MKILSVEAVGRVEAEANENGLTYDEMMQRAGAAVAARVKDQVEHITIREKDSQPRITVLVGPGKNGGDGLVAGRILAEAGYLVRFYLLKPRPDDDPLMQPIRAADWFVADAENDQRYRVLTHNVASADVIIDALFGIGARLPLDADTKKLLRAVTAAIKTAEDELEPPYLLLADTGYRWRPERVIVAVDCPSGMNADTGELDPDALHANDTVTFIAIKPGLLVFPGAEAVGSLVGADAGIPENTPTLKAAHDHMVTRADARRLLPVRPANANKGTFGKVLVIGGSADYTGAPGLSAQAAYRIGAGLVSVAAPAKVIDALAAQMLEVTWLHAPNTERTFSADSVDGLAGTAARYDALVLGPGLSQADGVSEFVLSLLEKLRANGPKNGIVIDADALNVLSGVENFWTHLPPNTVITPHPGEMSRLMSISVEDVQKDRTKHAREMATKWSCVVVLKGAHTVIASPNGQTATLPFKSSALAKAGTGDVLAGLIAGLLAASVKPSEAAQAGGYVHGYAGSLRRHFGNQRTLTASELLNYVEWALRDLED